MKMKKPLKTLLLVIVLVTSILSVAVFSSGGCRRVEEAVVEEVIDELEEEAIDESEAEEIVEESTAKGKIAFESDRDGNYEIYIMNVDGSEQTRLTDNPADDWGLSFSPDGSKIAFESYRDGNWEIYIMNIDGSEQTRLTDNPAFDWWPSFSP